MVQYVYENAEQAGFHRFSQPHEEYRTEDNQLSADRGYHQQPALTRRRLNIKNRILKTFVLGLHNSELSITYRLADQEEVGKVLTKNEVLELLMEKNPAMKSSQRTWIWS